MDKGTQLLSFQADQIIGSVTAVCGFRWMPDGTVVRLWLVENECAKMPTTT